VGLTALRAPCLFRLRTHKTGHSATPTHRSFAVPFLKFLTRLMMYEENRKNLALEKIRENETTFLSTRIQLQQVL
jgi:hypothetical protein